MGAIVQQHVDTQCRSGDHNTVQADRAKAAHRGSVCCVARHHLVRSDDVVKVVQQQFAVNRVVFRRQLLNLDAGVRLRTRVGERDASASK